MRLSAQDSRIGGQSFDVVKFLCVSISSSEAELWLAREQQLPALRCRSIDDVQ